MPLARSISSIYLQSVVWLQCGEYLQDENAIFRRHKNCRKILHKTVA